MTTVKKPGHGALSRPDFVGEAAAGTAFPVVPRHILGGVDGHEQDWIVACKAPPATGSNFDYSSPFWGSVVVRNLAGLHPERTLLWDGENMTVTNDERSDAFLRPLFREG